MRPEALQEWCHLCGIEKGWQGRRWRVPVHLRVRFLWHSLRRRRQRMSVVPMPERRHLRGLRWGPGGLLHLYLCVRLPGLPLRVPRGLLRFVNEAKWGQVPELRFVCHGQAD